MLYRTPYMSPTVRVCMAFAQHSQVASDFVTSKHNQPRVMSWSETQRLCE